MTPKQRPAAVRAMTGQVFVSLTVVLEFERVLRGFYELGRKDVVAVIRALAGMPQVHMEARDELFDACARVASRWCCGTLCHVRPPIPSCSVATGGELTE
ncbi:MAG TPA: hypothetical protein VLA61_16275 [Ideonella sp.]|uniref:hypothetical protein n=1 Tax=Ideonella sp. TaxID=1929293 RepID=UPI002BD14687|nr:hypothetical protein [Ideonella sp.]HSI49829.1 hypothetical protein [Ideonella sp.]